MSIVFNPHNKPVEELPFIIGFPNGGFMGNIVAVAVATDGHALGSHMSSDEWFGARDIGVEEGTFAKSRNETYQAHYPQGYRTKWVTRSEIKTDPDLKVALENNKKLEKEAKK